MFDRKMVPALVSTYPPRACGLAAFAADLRTSLLATQEVPRVDVVSIVRATPSRVPPDEVLFEIRQDVRRDYEAAAECLNDSDIDIVCLQHEFGIFGGYAGDYVLSFLERVRKPVVSVLHTVIPDRDPDRRETFRRVSALSDRVVVLNRTAEVLMQRESAAEMRKVEIIPHGVPDITYVDPDDAKPDVGLEGHTVLLTFGLLSPGKGIEFVLDALPAVAARHPDVMYVVLGATHPEVKKYDGERYREALMERVQAARLAENVRFVDRFVDIETLCRYLQACDVYVAPHRGQQQVSSGTLAYAVGAGRPVIASSFLHAVELLGDERGLVVRFGDVNALTRSLLTYVEQPALRKAVGQKAHEYTRAMTWGRVGRRYLGLFAAVCDDAQGRAAARAAAASTSSWLDEPGSIVDVDGLGSPSPISHALLQPTLKHLETLTDETGIFQHAPFGIPDRRHGYCTDDVSRALVAVLRHAAAGTAEPADLTVERLQRTYLAFLLHAQQADGSFRNVMSYRREFVDGTSSEDTQGRAIWALATAAVQIPRPQWRTLASRMLAEALGPPLSHPRALAYELLGLTTLLRAMPGHVQIRRRIEADADALLGIYLEAEAPDWKWFGDELTYANAIIPGAVLHAADVSGRSDYRRVGLAALEFLVQTTYRNDFFDFVGNQGWYVRGGSRAVFGQQPIDAGYMTAACAFAYQFTGQLQYLRWAEAAAEWFAGRNRLGLPLYDPATGVCADGLEADGVSQHAGAESAIVCQIGLQAAASIRTMTVEAPRRSPASTIGIRSPVH